MSAAGDLKTICERAKAAVEQNQNSVKAWLELSRAYLAAADMRNAVAAGRKAVALAPNDSNALREFAVMLYASGFGMAESRGCFERLLQLLPKDLTALSHLYYFALADSRYDDALDCAQRYFVQDSNNPRIAALVARAYDLLGDHGNCAKFYELAVQLCEDAKQSDHKLGALQPVYARGAYKNDVAERLSQRLCTHNGWSTAEVDVPQIPRAVRQIKQLQALVSGRDILLFGFGPSLQHIVDNRHSLSDVDFVSLSLSTFPIIAERVLKDIGRDVDIVCQTHPDVVRNHQQALSERFEDPGAFLLALPTSSQQTVAETPQLASHGDSIFWFNAVDDTPPHPADPLHFCSINTLLCALSIAVLSKPRRIFLFGFEGKIQGDSAIAEGSLYFAEDDPRYFTPWRKEEAVREQTRATLWWDSRRFNETAATALQHVAMLHEVPLPPIYNVCPDSALETFPRIDIADCLTLLRGTTQ